MVGNKIFINPVQKPNRKARLFCFPYAGGSINTYFPWAKKINKDIELIAVQPPGRGSRMTEKPHNSMDTLVAELMQYSDFITEKPFFFFGHSLGSRMAYDLAVNLRKAQKPLPKLLIASGSRAPHLGDTTDPIYNLPSKEFIEELGKLNGTPKELLAVKELMDILEPLLRADFQIAETYRAQQVELPIPIKVLHGIDDIDISSEMLNAWNELSVFDVDITHMRGDHFFINEYNDLVLEKVSDFIDSLSGVPNSGKRSETELTESGTL